MDKKNKVIVIISIISLIIVLITVTYAYFSARITGIESASTISMTAGYMSIHYTEGNEEISISNIYPREEAWVTKTFTLTANNTTTLEMKYEVGLNIITNTFKGGQLSYSLIVDQNNDGSSMSAVTNKAITGSNRIQIIGKGSFEGPITDGIQNYTLKIYFKDNGKNQNINQGAVFNANIIVQERINPSIECTDDAHPTLAQGNTYINGQYKYTYSTSKNGWSVELIDKNSTDPVTTPLCKYVNNVPVVRMANMFSSSKAVSIDLSSFDTSEVTDMASMFYGISATSLDLSFLDTSNVTDMTYMFQASKLEEIDLSNFDTSNVTSMNRMFSTSSATIINISSFDTSKVTDMDLMFSGSRATNLDLSSFDTSSVTTMESMFWGANSLTSLDLCSFDTSNVTNMKEMFGYITLTSLDLSMFDTSSVTTMNSMFYNSSAIRTIYVSDKFDTSNVTASSNMFRSCTNLVGGAGTTFDSSKTNKEYARVDNPPDARGYFTLKQ